ncbi:polysaccharide deacetylase family protein [candidate division KSB1 bacterium]|nr:polysaccharide deacetylase family protein [candidate division KSB1 bacterium]
MSLLPKIIRSMPDENIYLTFDDGPDENITPRLLELLSKHKIKATFFMVGQKAERYPEIVLQIHKNGHAIGNHSYTHPHLIFKSKESIEEEIKRTDEAVFEITGKRPTLFRPPHGQFGFAVLSILKSTNHRMVLWSASSQDYKVKTSTEKIQARMKKYVRPGKIVLMHDGHLQSHHMLEALKNSLDRFKEKNLKFSALLN